MQPRIAQRKATFKLSADTVLGAYLMLALTAFFLASNHVIGRSVHGVIPPIGLSFWRWAAGALMLAPFILPRIKTTAPIFFAYLKVYALLGFLMVGSTTLILVSLNFTTAINVSLVNAVQPTLTLLLAILFLKDRVSKTSLLGICSALLGVVIMVSKASWSVITGLEFNFGDLVALVAMIGFSSYALNLKKLPGELSVTESLFGITIAGSLMLLPFYVLESVYYAPVPVSASTLWVVIELALLVTVFGNLMWNQGNRIVGPNRAAIFINLIPVFGALLAVTFLGEKVYGYHFVGAVLVCLGIWLVVGNLNGRRKAD